MREAPICCERGPKSRSSREKGNWEIFVSQIFYNFFQFFFNYFTLLFFFNTFYPLLKKPSLDHTQFSNYSPFSNLTFISKAIERSVGNQLISYFNKNHESE